MYALFTMFMTPAQEPRPALMCARYYVADDFVKLILKHIEAVYGMINV